MKNERRNNNGSLEIVFGPIFRPSDEIDPDNPFARKKEIKIYITRECKTCGKKFVLHVEYDKENPMHDLCDDCILDLPLSETARYPEKTIQIEQNEINDGEQEFLEPGEELVE
jgi:hypothetical protein